MFTPFELHARTKNGILIPSSACYRNAPLLVAMMITIFLILRPPHSAEGAFGCSDVTEQNKCCNAKYNCFGNNAQHFCSSGFFDCSTKCIFGQSAICSRCSWCSTVGYCQDNGQCQYTSCAMIQDASMCARSTQCSWCSVFGYCTSTTTPCASTCDAVRISSVCQAAASAGCSWCNTLGGWCRDVAHPQVCFTSCVDIKSNAMCGVPPQCRWCSNLGGWCTAASQACVNSCQSLTPRGSTECVAPSQCQWCVEHNGRCKYDSELCITDTMSLTATRSWDDVSPSVSPSTSPTVAPSPTYYYVNRTTTRSLSRLVSCSSTDTAALASRSASATEMHSKTWESSSVSMSVFPSSEVSMSISLVVTEGSHSVSPTAERPTCTPTVQIAVTNTSTPSRHLTVSLRGPLSTTTSQTVGSSGTETRPNGTGSTSLSATVTIPLVFWPSANLGGVGAAAVTAALGAVFTGGFSGSGEAATLAAISLSSCTNADPQQVGWTSRRNGDLQPLVLSVFYDHGPVISVWGNVCLAVGVLMAHRTAVCFTDRFLLRRQRPRGQKGKTLLVVGSDMASDGAAREWLRFPSISIVVLLVLLPGVAFSSAACFGGSSSPTSLHVATGTIGIVVSVLCVALLVRHTARTVWPEVSCVAVVDLNDEESKWMARTFRSILPVVTWRPKQLVAQHAVMVSAVAHVEDLHVLPVLHIHGAIFSLIAGIPFPSRATCVVQYVLLLAWMLVPLWLLASRRFYLLRIRPLNHMAFLSYVMMMALIGATAVFYEGPESMRASASGVMDVLGWAILAMCIARVSVVVVSLVVGSLLGQQNIDVAPDGRSKVRDPEGDHQSVLSLLEQEVSTTHDDVGCEEERHHNWLRALQPPVTFTLGLPRNHNNNIMVVGDVASLLLRVPLSTRLEIARLDAVICSAALMMRRFPPQKENENALQQRSEGVDIPSSLRSIVQRIALVNSAIIDARRHTQTFVPSPPLLI